MNANRETGAELREQIIKEALGQIRKPTVEAGRICTECGHEPSSMVGGECRTRLRICSSDEDPYCRHRCHQPGPRMCQHGVDGSPGCGHPEGYYDEDDGCLAHWPGVATPIEGYQPCRHKCDFSPFPPVPETEWRDMDSLAASVLAVCQQRGWSLHWTHRGAYLHLESSELIEASAKNTHLSQLSRKEN